MCLTLVMGRPDLSLETRKVHNHRVKCHMMGNVGAFNIGLMI